MSIIIQTHFKFNQLVFFSITGANGLSLASRYHKVVSFIFNFNHLCIQNILLLLDLKITINKIIYFYTKFDLFRLKNWVR